MSTGRETANKLDSNLGESSEGYRCFALIQRVFDASQPFVLFLWVAGVMVSGARLTTGFLSFLLLRCGRTSVPPTLANRSTYYARRLGLTSARVFVSTGIREAAVVGFWKPVVLLPTSWLTTLPTDVLEAVIAHELAHIRRYDVWVNLLQRVVEALLFYHPAVWWLSNQIRLEREMCCDELAVDATDDRGNYAIALEQVGRLHVQGSRQLAMSFTGDRKMKLLRRIENVLGTDKPAQREPVWLASITAVSIPLLLVAIVGIQAGNNAVLAQEGKGSRLTKGEPTAERQRDIPRSSSSAEGVSRWELSVDGIPENGRFYKRALLFGDAIDDPLSDRSDIIQATVKRPGSETPKESCRIWLFDGKEPVQILLLDQRLTELRSRFDSVAGQLQGKLPDGKRALFFGDAIDDPVSDRSDIIQATAKRSGSETPKESCRIWLFDGKDSVQILLLDEELTETLRRFDSVVEQLQRELLGDNREPNGTKQ
ncbi:M56 family metallopeptidase [Stieleria varia]|nr:M56 family metallopeptidase [Stieleria varia]